MYVMQCGMVDNDVASKSRRSAGCHNDDVVWMMMMMMLLILPLYARRATSINSMRSSEQGRWKASARFKNACTSNEAFDAMRCVVVICSRTIDFQDDGVIIFEMFAYILHKRCSNDAYSTVQNLQKACAYHRISWSSVLMKRYPRICLSDRKKRQYAPSSCALRNLSHRRWFPSSSVRCYYSTV